MNSPLHALLGLASRRRLSVLIYHRVLPQADELLPGETTAAVFEQTMRWVRSFYNVIPLHDAIEGIRTGKLPTRALSITFDDGYANNATIAAPILKRLGLHATFFIATGYIGGGRMFNDTVIEAVRGFAGSDLDLESLGLGNHGTRTAAARRQAISAILSSIKYRPQQQRTELAEKIAEVAKTTPRTDLMMTAPQAHDLARQGFALGAHTVSHPILAQVDDAVARQEIWRGRAEVEELAGGAVRLFAYPNGRPGVDYLWRHVQFAKEAGFAGAVSTARGVARVGADVYQIPRFTPWQSKPWRFGLQLGFNLANDKYPVADSSASSARGT